jgi:hypothetical protein
MKIRCAHCDKPFAPTPSQLKQLSRTGRATSANFLSGRLWCLLICTLAGELHL